MHDDKSLSHILFMIQHGYPYVHIEVLEFHARRGALWGMPFRRFAARSELEGGGVRGDMSTTSCTGEGMQLVAR